MNRATVLLGFLLLVPRPGPELQAAERLGMGGAALSGHAIVLLLGSSGVIGAGLSLDVRLARGISLGTDLIEGIDSDGAAYTMLMPALACHFNPRSKRSDLFAGLGLNTIACRPGGAVNSYFASTSLLGFAGARLYFSRGFGVQFRVFANQRIFGGFSAGLTARL